MLPDDNEEDDDDADGDDDTFALANAHSEPGSQHWGEEPQKKGI